MAAWWRNKRGQSVMEVLIAVAVFAVLAGGVILLVLNPLVSTAGGADRTRAVFLATQGLEAARAIKENLWTDLAPGTHGLAVSASGTWTLSGSSDLVDGEYLRQVVVSTVMRDGSGAIVGAGGTVDPRIKRVEVTVSWTSGVLALPRSVVRSQYLADWNSYAWTRTTDVHFDAGDRSSAVMTGSATAASILLSGSAWNVSGGTALTHKNDADFGPGAYASTALIGTGDAARVELAIAPQWLASENPGITVTHTSSADFASGTTTQTVIVGTGEPAGVQLDNSTGWRIFASPTANSLRSVAMVSSSDGWAVGLNGVIARYSGGSWSTVSTPTSDDLNGVAMVSANDGWAVGEGGRIVRWNGSAWATVTSPTTQDLFSVAMASSSDGWAVGGSGKILRWNGSAWSEFLDIGSTSLLDVQMLSATDGWIVGGSGLIYRWNGTTWSLHTDTGNQTWNSVHLLTATDGWVVGGSGIIYRWNGTAWSAHTDTGNQTWNGVRMISSGDVWAVGNGGLVAHFDGSAWTASETLVTDDLYGTDFVGVNNGWGVGEGGRILRYDDQYFPDGTFVSSIVDAGESVTWSAVAWTQDLFSQGATLTVATRTGNVPWPDGTWSAWSAELSEPFGSPIASPAGRYIQYRVSFASLDGTETATLNDITLAYGAPGTATIQGVQMLSATDGWMVGFNGSIQRYDGSSWSSVTSPTTDDLYDLDFVSATDGWAVGEGGRIVRWNGSTWATVTSPTTLTLYAVDLISSSDGWATGDNGVILRWNGTSWSLAATPTNRDLRGLSMVASGDAWAVGQRGEILRLTGSTWATFTSPTGSDLYAVDMLSSSDGQAVGKGGVTLRWNGTNWTALTPITNSNLLSIDLRTASDGWAVGGGGRILRWNGSVWSLESSPVTKAINGVSAVGAEDVWAGGYLGLLLHYTPAYLPSGTFQSAVFDSATTVGTVWNIVSWTEVLPAGANVTVSTRTGNTPTPDGSWSAWSGELTDETGSAITSPAGRYLQYRLTLTRATSPFSTSSVDDVTALFGQQTGQNLRAFASAAANDIWISGLGGVTLRKTGTAWSLVATPVTRDLYGIDMSATNAGAAVGANGTILSWNGASWTEATSPTTRALNGVDLVSSTDGWAVGAQGAIVRLTGVTWANATSPTTNALNAVRMLSSTDGWAVGVSGTIVRWNGASWATVGSPTTDTLNALSFLNATDGWAVGNGGRIIRWNGASWATVTSPTASNLRAIAMRAPSDGWAAGDNGTILHWDGVSWTVTASPTTRAIYGMGFADKGNNNGWIAAVQGRIFQGPVAPYFATGRLFSSVLDMDSATATPMTVSWTSSVPSGTSLTMAVRTGNVPVPDGSWTAFSPEVSVGYGSPFVATPGRYAQLRATFSASDTAQTPTLDDFQFTYR